MTEPHHHIVIVGSGFAGLGTAIELKRSGRDDFVVLERADALGGTWRANHYPGCACDVPTPYYSYSFAPKPDWSRFYAPYDEIRAYLEDCADSFDVRRHFRTQTTVTALRWSDEDQRWTVEVDGAPAMTADAVVAAPGGLARPAYPDIEGLAEFAGPWFHSAEWDHSVDLSGACVAVLGTGASAIQFVPRIARSAARVEVFQRTPPWVLPKPDRPHPQARAVALPPLPARPARGPSRRVGHAGVDGARQHRQPPLHQAARGRRPSGDSPLDQGPGAARAPDARLCGRLQAPAAGQRLVSGAGPGSRRRGQRPHRASDRARPRHRRRRRARSRRPHLRHGVPRDRSAGRAEGRGARRPQAGRPLARRHAGPPRYDDLRLPQLLPDARAEHRHRPHLAGLHDRGPDPPRAGGDGADARARRREHRTAGRGPARLQRVDPQADAADGLAARRLLELVPRRPGAQHHALAGFVARLPAGSAGDR